MKRAIIRLYAQGMGSGALLYREAEDTGEVTVCTQPRV